MCGNVMVVVAKKANHIVWVSNNMGNHHHNILFFLHKA